MNKLMLFIEYLSYSWIEMSRSAEHMSEEFIEKYKSKLDLNLIGAYQKLSRPLTL